MLEFVVDGSGIPDVDFDIGESYAGQLPIGGDSDGELYFWFFPSTADDADKEILLWLNGGVSSFSNIVTRSIWQRAPLTECTSAGMLIT